MKKIILILIALAIQYIALSQDYEPRPIYFPFCGDTTYYLSNDSARLKQDEFMFGWHWDHGRRMSEVLKIHQAHTSYGQIQDGYEIVSPAKIIVNTPYVYARQRDTTVMQAPAVMYKPNLLIDEPDEFKTIECDNSNPIFGFLFPNLSADKFCL